MNEPAKYDHYCLIVHGGNDPTHEWIHFLHNVATTFGMVQIISYHIDNKARNMLFRYLGRKGILQLPIQIKKLKEPTIASDPEIKRLVRIIQNTDKFNRKYVGEMRPKVQMDQSDHWYSGKISDGAPVLNLPCMNGISLGQALISELHNLIVAKLSGQRPIGFLEKFLLEFAEKKIKNDPLRLLCYLCDWSMMTPYAAWTGSIRHESHPGWRFALGLDFLSGLSTEELNGLGNYTAFFDVISAHFGFHTHKSTLDLIMKFASWIGDLSHNDSEAGRNRRFYATMRKFFQRVYEFRNVNAEVFALPHLYSKMLKETLAPLVMDEENRFWITPEIQSWYMPYLHVIVQGHQAFSRKDGFICCAFHHFRLNPEISCLEFQNAQRDQKCYQFPDNPDDAGLINCEFLREFRSLHFSGITSFSG